jgi:hypothetical protein
LSGSSRCLNVLSEDAVLVPQAVPGGGKGHRRHRIEEACRETSEPAVPKSGVGFLLEERGPVDVLLPDDLPGQWREQEVRGVVGEGAAEQKLHREVVHTLRVLSLIRFLGVNPSLREDVSHRAGEGLEPLPCIGGRQPDDVVEDEMAFVEPVVRPRERDGTAAVLLEKLRTAVGYR